MPMLSPRWRHRRLRGAVAARAEHPLSPAVADSASLRTDRGEDLFFLRRWMANPLKVGSLIPSSPALARLVARQVRMTDDQAVIEVGAGTGALTRAVLAAGLPTDRLFIVEIDPRMAAFLRRQFRHVKVIHGDATRLSELLPVHWHGRIGTVICGIPVVNMTERQQRRLIDESFRVLAPEGRFLQFTYLPVSPFPQDRLGIKGQRLGTTLMNLPPAQVWGFSRAEPLSPAA